MSVKLFELPRNVVVQNGPEAISIDRVSGEISQIEPNLPSTTPSLEISGVLGLIELPHSRYLAIARTSRLAGMLANAPVFRVKTTLLLPLTPPDAHDEEYVKLLSQHLKDATLFYSPVYDMTSNRQRAAQLQSQGLPSRNDEFFWNYEISRSFAKFEQFVLPVIYGVFSVAEQMIGSQNVEFAVVTRRSRFRAGTRYFRRGLDASGHAANFNETEQVLVVQNKVFSFLQTRGSVPAVWSEVNDLKYKPQLKIGNLEESVSAARKHFKQQEAAYGKIYLVNLVNQKGYEKPVKDIYEQVVSQLNDKLLQYIYFDFHHECSKMRWHRVQLLVDELVSLGLNQSGWFEAVGNATTKLQEGVVRTNCMDCLDRTNVVQSTLALHALKQQLETAGLLGKGDAITQNDTFMAKFRNIWADNADGVSCAYSGTGALKTDFTRTGQRTKLGALRDLQNSIVRYYRNNFCDGPRQDGFSLFLNDHTPISVDSNPFLDTRNLWVQSVPYILSCCALVTVLSTLYPSQKHSTLFNFVVTSCFGIASALSLRFIAKNGLQYVNWPSLSPVLFVDKYGGEYHVDDEYKGIKEE